jgi:hypothetical protein
MADEENRRGFRPCQFKPLQYIRLEGEKRERQGNEPS